MYENKLILPIEHISTEIKIDSVEPVKGDVSFQIIDWKWFDDDDTDKYTIRLFGITSVNKTICVNVSNYLPYFFLKI